MTQGDNSGVKCRWRGLVLIPVMLLASPASADAEATAIQPIVVQPAKSATLQELMTKLRSERLVYVGETHTDMADHNVQLAVLRGMASRSEGLAIGVEWIQARFQHVLDDYIAGRIDEAGMLRGTEYYQRWRFDYRLYRPIMRYAREKGIPVIALNASRELTSAISQHGINSLPPDVRKELPDSYDVTDKVYETRLRETFALHGGDDDSAFQRFVEVQLTWDESMAQRVAEYLRDHPDGSMLVLAGKGHIGGRNGIPNRVTRRTGLRGATIVRYNPAAGGLDEADHLVLAPNESLPPSGMLRVMLDERDEGVFIDGFSRSSPAESAGMKKGDRLLSINGHAIRHFVDVKVAMIDQRPGNEVAVRVLRDPLLGGERTLEMKIPLAPEQ
ncbi:MAG: ChaN family lipoprotein [Gammaproteobacteria bacterium]|nr:ChaN family lipoprotein [Gammaproteobacteria bacterium]